MSLPQLIAATKAIAVSVAWTTPGPSLDEGGYTRFQVPLDVDGITESGLVLEGGAFASYRDRDVCFELNALGHNGRRRIPLMRLEWRSRRGGHSNQRKTGCQGPWAGKRVPATHIHTFEANWLAEKDRMRKGDLPCAEPIEEEIQSFEELRVYVGRRFRINNIGVVPHPDWRYDLFDEGDGHHGSRDR